MDRGITRRNGCGRPKGGRNRSSRRNCSVGGGQAVLDKAPPHPLHGGDGNLDGHRDVRVQQAPFRATFIGFEENARMGLPEGGSMFLTQKVQELLSF